MQVPVWFTVFVLGFLPATHGVNIMCGPPPSIEFASVNPLLEEYPVGESVTYSCNYGYVPDSSIRTSQCSVIGKRKADWTEPQMSCIPRSCGDPGYVVNGHRLGSVFSFPSSVVYECDEGYRLIGNAKRYCQVSGSWSGRLPRCEAISCNNPEHPKNGRVIFSSLNYGSELQYECEKGFKPENDIPATCTAEGTWSHKVDCIEVACGVPVAPDFGSVDLINAGENLRAGSIAMFSCEAGRIPNGPTTSKCLDIGQWTFPAPKCLEPCSVPFVANGKIGRYVSRGYGRSMVFQQISVGGSLEDNEKLFLHCSKGYDPMGSDNWQARVTCNKGEWAEEPYCEPASCRSNPPSGENLDIIEFNDKHGSSVVYRCLPDFKMVTEGSVTCNFGEWKGTTPTCKDTRCSVNDLNFGGLKMSGQIYYRSGELFLIECNSGYQVSKKNNGIMKCEEGSWNGPMPPCTAASCVEPPPKLEHGRIESFSSAHSSTVKYACDDAYILTGKSQMQCLFGEWKGDLPTCRDSRCFLKDLRHRAGISSETEAVTSSGNELNVRCETGYTAKWVVPFCYNSAWSRNDKSPCVESDCIVERIPNGNIQETRTGDSYFSWSNFRWQRPILYENVPIGRIIKHNTMLYITCNGKYTFQGKGYDRTEIACIKGRWNPEPVCLITGTTYYPNRAASKVETNGIRKQPESETKLMSTIMAPTSTSSSSTTEVHPDRHTTENDSRFEITSSVQSGKCSCEITVQDDNLVAYMNDRLLKIHDTVENGSVVKFRCKDVGFQHLIGDKEITCQNCRTWHSSEFPTCVQPKRGDAVIAYDDKVNVTVNGTLEIRKGEAIRLFCIAMEEAKFPTWTVPSVTGANVQEQRVDRGSDVLYVTFLDIKNPEFKDEGWYTCAVENFNPSIVYISVVDPFTRCQKFLEEEEDFIIVYDNDQRAKSKATFSCRKEGQKLLGNRVLTCLSNGEWSSPPPQCNNITCRELKQTDLMLVSYTDDQRIGSFASFHCFAPGQRSGVSRTKCLENGEWSDPIPTCITPPCSIETLFSKVPQNVEPNMEDVFNETMPFNTTLRLICADGMTLVGDPFARCGNDGEWIVGTIQCILGCGRIDKPPGSLIITPQRDTYRIGQSVTFSCLPGQELNTDLEMIMCLSSGWSDKTLPQCVDIKEDDYEEV